MAGPRFLSRLAPLVLPNRDREFVLGDIEELYERRKAERGPWWASACYLRDVMLSAIQVTFRRTPPLLDPKGPLRRANWRTGGWSVFDDFGLALRSVRRRPRFALAAAGILALGVGPAVAVFSMAEQLLLRPLPGAANTNSAAYLVFGTPGRPDGLTQSDFDELRRATTLARGMASYGRMLLVATPEAGRPIAVSAANVYGDYFEILGVTASEGRLLGAAETSLDADPLVAVISESLRDQVFGVDAAAVGRTLTLNGHPVEIVGVTAGGFMGAERGSVTEAWLPHGSLVPLVGFPPNRLRGRESSLHLDILVGVDDGTTPEAIETEVSQVVARIAADSPESADDLPESAPRVFAGLHTPPLVRELTQRTFRMMAWAVVLLLAIACANVANLLLFRNLARRGALATQRALGASTARLARLHLAESLLLGLLGCAAAAGVAWLISVPFSGERLPRMPALEGFTLAGSTVLFTAGLAVLTALVVGAAPAALSGRFDLGAALKASRGCETGRIGPLRVALSVGQVALTLALLVGGLLMVRTIANLRSVETGLDVDNVAWTGIGDRAPGLPDAEDHLRQRELVAALSALPGVEGVALDLYGPHGSRNLERIGLPGAPVDPSPTMESLTTQWQVTPDWFRLFAVTPVSGRTFQDEEWRFPAGDEVVLTASLARRLFGRVDVAGSTVLVGVRNPAERRVIGVVGDYRTMTSPAEPLDAFFVPLGAIPRRDFSVLVRFRPEARDAVARVREAIESFYPDLPVPEVQFLSERVESLRTEERVLGYLLWMLSAFGVVMSAVGLYGVIYFVASSRKKELGIRRALGADAVRVVRLVSRSAALVVVLGVILGAVAAYALTRTIESALFGVEGLDPASYVGAATLVLAAAFVAGVAPVRAALRVDPVTVLKDE